MARIDIADLQTGLVVDQVFMLTRRDIRSARNNTLYLAGEVADRTGTLPAKMWNLNDAAAARLPETGPVRVRGRVDSYQGALQLLVDNIQFVELTADEAAALMPHSPFDVAEMFNELTGLLETVENPHLRALIEAFLADEEKMEGLRRCPAAISMHQAYLGGLLEHTLAVARLAGDAIGHYPQVNGDLLLTGVFLHDLGKIDELRYEGSFEYTDRGNLVGHLAIAVEWLGEKIRHLDAARDEPFPPEIKMALEHLILSHHGEHEYGSPKLPMTAEAIALHFLDNLDAKLWRYAADVAADNDPTASFTQKSWMFGRKLYKRNVLETEEAV